MKEEPAALNPTRFARMARGDTAGLIAIAGDYFKETRRLMPAWLAMLEAGDFGRLREELHRCKGGAAIFGLDRLAAMIMDYETPRVLETRGFDVEAFEQELRAAECAVSRMMESVV
ncbi:MAG: Hpt domain-containing protein [Verrucomicrobia bacterium]|nr:Hpt domain-containing protein [Verrucomicrobiota bacterium]